MALGPFHMSLRPKGLWTWPYGLKGLGRNNSRSCVALGPKGPFFMGWKTRILLSWANKAFLGPRAYVICWLQFLAQGN